MRFLLLPAFGFAPFSLALLAAVGCSDSAAIQPGDIRTYLAPLPPKQVAKKPAEPSTQGGLAITYDTPGSWTDRGASGMRLATLTIESGGNAHEVTVIPASGTLEANVSRWLGQLDPAASPEALIERTAAVVDAAKKLPVGEAEATVVSLIDEKASASEEAILGAMVPLDDSASLFVKLKGPAEIARREYEAFCRFVSSIRWNQEPRR